MRKSLILLLLAFQAVVSFAQKSSRVEVLSLKKLSFTKVDGKKARILQGDVKFRKDSVIFTCDSAIQFLDNEIIHAFGNVSFNRGDSLKLTGDELIYNELTQMAEVMGKKVTMSDNKMKLETRKLFYNLETDMAYYLDSAFIRDQENTLWSKKGYYYSKTKDMYFKQGVHFKNEQYSVLTDTLRYNVETENSYFIGPSHISSKEGDSLYCERGLFITKQNEVRLGKNSRIVTDGKVIQGDSLQYFSATGIGFAFKRCKLIDTTQNLEMEGNYAEFNQREETYLLTDSVLMTNFVNDDTVFLSADTLFLSSDSSGQIARAFHHVRIFSKTYQATCDSLYYPSADSTMKFYGSPVFWSEDFQLTARFVTALLGEKGIKKIDLAENAFLSVEHPFDQYDQFRGDSMTIYFAKQNLSRVLATGNCSSIYYAFEEDSALIAANQINGKSAAIRFKEGKIAFLKFAESPEAKMTPANKIVPAELVIKGFEWRGKERPLNPESVYQRLKNEKIVVDPTKALTN